MMARSKEFDEEVVLKKAMELFWEQGYEKTSISDLVEHMGIHRKSLYDTFVDKHTLYLRAIDCYRAYTTDKLKYEVLQAKTASKAIKNIFEYTIEASADHPEGCLFVNAATETALQDLEVDQRTQEAFTQTEDLFTQLIHKGQQESEFTCDLDASALAEILHSTLLGIRVLARTSTPKEKLHQIADHILAILKTK